MKNQSLKYNNSLNSHFVIFCDFTYSLKRSLYLFINFFIVIFKNVENAIFQVESTIFQALIMIYLYLKILINLFERKFIENYCKYL